MNTTKFSLSSIFSSDFTLILSFLGILLLGFLIGYLVFTIKNLKNSKKQRKDAVNRSRSVIAGQVLEQVAPFLPDFPCNPEDAKFLGKPVDFIGFVTNDKKGLNYEDRPIEEVLFIEVKSGNSQLSNREKELKKAIDRGKVRYVEYRIPGGK